MRIISCVVGRKSLTPIPTVNRTNRNPIISCVVSGNSISWLDLWDSSSSWEYSTEMFTYFWDEKCSGLFDMCRGRGFGRGWWGGGFGQLYQKLLIDQYRVAVERGVLDLLLQCFVCVCTENILMLYRIIFSGPYRRTTFFGRVLL